MNSRTTRATNICPRPSVAMTHGLASIVAVLAVACGQGTGAVVSDAPPTPSQGGTGETSDAGAVTLPGAGGAPGNGGHEDAGPTADAGYASPDAQAAPDAAAPDAAAPVMACTSNASISALLAQYGSDSTVSAITPMGTRFEAAAQAGPISASNAALLSTASANPDVSAATSATGLEWQSVAVRLYPSGTPSPEDIMQHDIGDCDGDSALASMAYVNPHLVTSRITDNGDGTFAVAMFDPMGKPITVAVSSEVLVESGGSSNLGQVSANDGTADWATILEKAVMKYDYAYNMVGQLDGIGSEEMVPMFTGTGEASPSPPGR